MSGSGGMTEAKIEPRALATRASGSSFYASMRLMPKAQREAMFAVYAFSRAVDDIADDAAAARDIRSAELDRWRDEIQKLYVGRDAPRASFLVPPVKRYRLRKEDFLSLIDGMAMDVAEDIRAPDLNTLDLYCDRVASAVGRLSIKIFGMEEEPGFQLAHHLGRALQLTNILRDLDEDAGVGRLYLPREHLHSVGIATREPIAAITDPAIDRAGHALAHLAHEHYRGAESVIRSRPRGRLCTPRLMGAVYRRILAKMEQVGWAPPRERVRLRKGELLTIVLRYGLI